MLHERNLLNAMFHTTSVTKSKRNKMKEIFISWLVGFLWHINLCRLFDAKSIFIQIISSISNNSVQH